MTIIDAAIATIRVIRNQYPKELSPENLRLVYLMDDIIFERVVDRKAHRFLGWAQSKIDSDGYYTMEQFRVLNRVNGVDE